LCQEKSGNPGFNVLISLKDIRVVFGGTDQILVTPDTLGPVVATNTIRILTGFYKKNFSANILGDFDHFFSKI
jgi:hypothetical protein